MMEDPSLGSQKTEESHILLRLKKTKPLATIFSVGSNQEQASILAFFPPVYFLPTSSQDQEYILTYFLPTYLSPTGNQAHPVQLSQTSLFREVRTCGLLSPINKNLQHFRKYPSLGKGLTG